MSKVLRIRLTGRAMRFLHLLQDFGHLDEERLDDLFVALSEFYGSKQEAIVDLPAVRRVAAAVLFGGGSPDIIQDIEQGVLSEDWPLLFS